MTSLNSDEDVVKVMGADVPLAVQALSNQQVRSADYLGMQSVTACNNTCIRGD